MAEMAELVLTEAEKAAKTWLELDDATVGKLVKSTTLKICDHSDEFGRIAFISAAILLCGGAAQANATNLVQEIKGLTLKGVDFGDWTITIRRVDEKRNDDA